jgi:hypothetical protein
MSGGFTCHETKSVKEYLTDLKDFVEKRLGKDVKLAIPQVYNTQVMNSRTSMTLKERKDGHTTGLQLRYRTHKLQGL